MLRGIYARVLVIGLTAVVAGCATGPVEGRPAGLRDAVSPAWSLNATSDEMIVSVSPARQTMQLAGSSGAIIGAGVAAVANDRYRRQVREALDGYDAGAVFEERLAARLEESVPRELTKVAPLGSTAGFNSTREAEKARYAAIAKRGADVLLELKMTYGLFGPGGTLVAKLDGQLRLVPEGKKVWDETIVIHTEPILAGQKLADPTKQLAPDFSALRLSAEDDAVTQWTRDGGGRLRTSFEQAVDAAVSALLCGLGLAEEATGEYYLGKLAMNRKRFDEADGHFRKALTLDPGMPDAQNGRAVNLAHNGQADEAIRIARDITEANPQYAPAWMNLAWWYAVAKKDAEAAKPFYEKALKLGLSPDGKIDKALQP